MLANLDPRLWLARCVRCGERGAPLCRACRVLPLVRTQTPAGCLVFAIGPYSGHLGDCLRRLKYQDETHLAFPLGRALRLLTEDSWASLGAGPDVLLPVPLHPIRLAERGYNQAALIAGALARRGHTRVTTSCLFRTEVRAAQARLSGQERRTNLLGAFVARHSTRFSPGAKVFLLDDVVTTGSTIDACSTALETIGVHVTGVLACAIAGAPGKES